MDATETNAEGLRHELKIVIGAAEIADRVKGRLTALQRTAKLPGFRPGKVPMDMLRKRFGPQVMGEAVEEAVGQSSTKAMQDRGLRPAMRPEIKITRFAEGADLEFEMAVEVMPEIEPGDFADLALERPVVEVTDAQVEDALAGLVDRQRRFEPAPERHAATEGDQIVIDFEGKIDGQAFAGGIGKDHPVLVGAGHVLPDLDKALAGRAKGDAFAVDVAFPETYPSETVRGKTARFAVTVKDVRVRQELAADDAFAKALGLEDLAALKGDLRKHLAEDFARQGRARLKRALLDALARRYGFEVPKGMVDVEFGAIWRQVEAELGRQKGETAAHDHAHDHDHHHDDDHDHEHDHGHHHHDHDHDHAHEHAHKHAAPDDPDTAKLKAEYRDIAERRVRLGLLLAEVARRNNIDVAPEDLNRAIVARARQFPGQERKVFDYYTKNAQALQELRAPIFEDKVVDHILSKAKISDRVVTAEELAKVPEDEQEISTAAVGVGTGDA
jgi:trigger factor